MYVLDDSEIGTSNGGRGSPVISLFVAPKLNSVKWLHCPMFVLFEGQL